MLTKELPLAVEPNERIKYFLMKHILISHHAFVIYSPHCLSFKQFHPKLDRHQKTLTNKRILELMSGEMLLHEISASYYAYIFLTKLQQIVGANQEKFQKKKNVPAELPLQNAIKSRVIVD